MDWLDLSDAEAEEWLWLLSPAEASEAGTDWSAVIRCLRDCASEELGERWQEHDCAQWADLIEALTTAAPPEDAGVAEKASSSVSAECH
jgi:hypothetical protein